MRYGARFQRRSQRCYRNHNRRVRIDYRKACRGLGNRPMGYASFIKRPVMVLKRRIADLVSSTVAVVVIAALTAVVISLGAAPATAEEAFTLSPWCPPALRLNEDGLCQLHSRYQQYDSLYDKGVGGLKTGLPAWREGFTPQQIDLGRYLFFDPILSADGTVACASCHQPSKGFSDGLAQSQGINNGVTQRSAPSLWNVSLFQRLRWDGGAASLEEQMLGPLYAENEMGNTPAQLLTNLSDSPNYPGLFAQAFGAPTITHERVYRALAAFESSLISLNSRYDLYAHGVHDALNAREVEGLNVFRSFVARCAECHTPPLFSNQQIAVIGVPEPNGKSLDPGAQAITQDPSQRAGFRVPSLRNVSLTAPYMHAGNFASLKEAVRFYTQGRGHAVPEGEDLKIHWHIWEPQLRDDELDAIVTFLGSLTDQSFMPEIPQSLPSGLAPVSTAIQDNNNLTAHRGTP